MDERVKKAWEKLRERGINTKEQAEDLFNKTEVLDFGFFATKLDLVELKQMREEVFGGN